MANFRFCTKRGRKPKALAVYDLEQRRLIDEECTRRAIDFMKRSSSSGKPFYLYVPYTLVHPLPNPKFAGKTGYGDFPDALAEMDANVGNILDTINALGIRDNTIVVFTSDNGPEATWPWQGSSGPWRGYYFTHMEGSLRVPFIMRWPGRIPADRVSNEIVHEVDTFTVDQMDFLLGKSDKSSRERFPVYVADRLCQGSVSAVIPLYRRTCRRPFSSPARQILVNISGQLRSFWS
jgi:membrane-anchored protein YejM (alkaline phosphatase superfamily)